MRSFSKSKLMALRQCPKRLWLETHHPELRDDSSAAQASFAVGHAVGDIARRIYDPKAKGTLVDLQSEGMEAAFARTQELLGLPQPIFEAGFRSSGAHAFADVLLPVKRGGQLSWRMVEVKSSTSVKDYHRDDAAVQAFVAKSSGAALTQIAIAHIDSTWIYSGDDDYSGLLTESDLTEEAFGRGDEVVEWIASAQTIAANAKPPKVNTGGHCSKPYQCGFYNHCRSSEPQPEQAIEWLPGKFGKKLQEHIDAKAVIELGDAPDELLNAIQLRVKSATVRNKPYFDRAGAAQELAPHSLPAYFLDFETIQFAVPIWKGTRPYQQIPFQFSLHRLSRTGKLEHQAFLDDSGGDPSKAFAQALLGACGERGPIFAYNAGFEKARISDLASRFPRLATALLALNERLVDLLPVARKYSYHPSQQGSWSIKAVLPALCPDLNYADLNGVQDGGMAMEAYLEAIAPSTTPARKAQIHAQLLDYCALDTFAMVCLWSVFTGTTLKS